MAYTNSSLVNYTKLSPNHSGQRTHVIDTISIHCVVGQCSVETLGNVFADRNREASSNYGIGYDGRIGLYVEEKNRSWCTSSASNDNRAITIEVASDTTHPYAVNSKAYKSLINLLVDICKRNGIKKLLWKGDKSLIGQVSKQNMTVHRWFDNKSCPGEYLYSRHGQIAAEVNKRLGVSATPTVQTNTSTSGQAIKEKDVVKISSGAKYYNTTDAVPNWVIAKKWVVKSVSGSRVVIDRSTDGKNAIMSAIDKKFLTVVGGSGSKNTPASTFKPYLVTVTADVLNIRKGAGTNYNTNGSIKQGGAYTIVAEANGKGATKWGKLKSGAGWISLDYVKKI